MEKITAVLDTNICLDLFVFHDSGTAPLFDAIENGSIRAVTRADCFEEWMRVLSYPKLGLAEKEAEAAKAAFARYIEQPVFSPKYTAHLPLCSDPDDRKFMEAAFEAGADVLFTKDRALLKLAAKNRRMGLFRIMTPEKWIRSGI